MSKSKIDCDTFQLGITEQFSCSYLPQKTEQLVFVQNNQALCGDIYEALMQRGFRRSGNDVYQPHCPQCSACQSTRILVNDFVPNRSQRRIHNKNRDLHFNISHTPKPAYFDLYQRYIATRHADGGMFPPQREQFNSFLKCRWLNCLYFEFYLDQQLVSVAINDCLPHSLSAVYTFFDPDQSHRSLGTLNILKQIEYASAQQLPHVYLGYYIATCASMNYKKNFAPQERFVNGCWLLCP